MPAFAASSLRHALHDLRGPLNTLAIAHEILRTIANADRGAADALAMATRAVRQLGTMLDQLRAVADTVSGQRAPFELEDALAEVVPTVAGATRTPVVAVDTVGARVTLCSDRARVVALLHDLLQCAAAGLPAGGTLRVCHDADDAACTLTVALQGERAALPPANTATRLSGEQPGGADWFRLGCRTAGLGGELVLDGDRMPPSIRLRLPRI